MAQASTSFAPLLRISHKSFPRKTAEYSIPGSYVLIFWARVDSA
jgi:hypothetical protein